MGLAQTQALLARLYTDGSFREAFLQSPESVAAKAGLTAEEAACLAQRCGEDARAFARSLHVKRCKEAASYLPRTKEALGPELFRRLFFQYAAGFLPEGINKPKADAIGFAQWLVRSRANEGFLQRETVEIARWESARLEKPTRRFMVRQFRLPAQDGTIGRFVMVWVRLGRLFEFIIPLLRPRERRGASERTD